MDFLIMSRTILELKRLSTAERIEVIADDRDSELFELRMFKGNFGFQYCITLEEAKQLKTEMYLNRIADYARQSFEQYKDSKNEKL